MRRNTITPETASTNTELSSPAHLLDKEESKQNVDRTRRFSEPFNARLYEFQPVSVRRAPNRKNLSDGPPQPSSEESDSDTSERRTPATSPRAFQNSFEKRNNRFFAGSTTGWRTSVLLDEQPIQEEAVENEEQPQTVIIQEPTRNSTIIKIIMTPPCN